jgi:hypothetical protein
MNIPDYFNKLNRLVVDNVFRTMHSPDEPVGQDCREPMAAVGGTATESAPSMPYSQGIEIGAWREVPAKVDGLCTEMEYVHEAIDEVPSMIEQLSKQLAAVYRSLKEMQQDKQKVVALQKELKGANDKADAASKKWKKVASQVTELQSQRNVTAQISDSDLISRVSQLRYQIRAFSAQYFEGKPLAHPRDLSPNGLSRHIVEAADRGLGDYYSLLVSKSRGPFVIQSFLWDVLARAVFENYCWAPWLRTLMMRQDQASKQGRYH